MRPLRSEDVKDIKTARPSVYVFRSACSHLYAGAAAANGSPVTPAAAAQRLFGGDIVTDAYMRRGASAPATTTGAGWAAALVEQSVFDMVQVATSLSAGAHLISSALKVSLASQAQVMVPGRVVDAAAAGMWVAEGAVVPVRASSFSAVTLLRRKLAVIAVFTRETAESSNIEAVVRQTLTEASGLALDAAMLSSAPLDAARPAGLLFGVTALAPTAGGGSVAMVGDIGKLVADLAARGGGLAPTFVAAPAQATAIKLLAGPRFDAPVLASAALPNGVVVAIEAASLAVGFDSVPEFSVSRAGTLHMEDAAPQHIHAASPARELFQTDCLSLRMTLAAAFAMRAPHVAWIQNTTW